MKSHTRLIFYPFIIMTPLALLFFSVYLPVRDYLFMHEAGKTTATVVGHKLLEPIQSELARRMQQKNETAFPLFQYIVNGHKYVTQSLYHCNDGCHAEGAQFDVYYDKEHPQIFLVNTFKGRWFGAMICFALGSILALAVFGYFQDHYALALAARSKKNLKKV